MGLRIKGCWSGAGEAGHSAESVDTFVARMADFGINAIWMGVKEGDGRIVWPSARFPQIVKPPYDAFDFPAHLLESCRKRGVECHAWFIDYYEGESSPAFQQHPEWAAHNRLGKTTSEETLRGKRFGSVWMCPARRPGYTDQWLIPLYEEFAARYEFDTVHHDYIRYPGDMAPDQYCFCDYCLEQIPRFAGFVSETYPNEPFLHEKYDRPYLESHWEPSPRVLPADWATYPREFRADFLLEGKFFAAGRADLDYFFYLYRTHQIEEFARICAGAVRATNPKIGISAAVFKNPVHSGRFIGQDWRRMGRWIDVAMPMNYRDHFPGTFEQYLGILRETIGLQRDWAREFAALYVGVAINFLFKEEPDGPFPGEKLIEVGRVVSDAGAEGLVLFSSDQIGRFGMEDAVRFVFR